MSSPLYHGGRRRLDGRGRGLILPPARTGVKTTADYGAGHVCRRDRVYLTTDLDAARFFALMAEPGGGDVYLVEAVGELEPDPDYLAADEAALQAPMARIVRVVERRVREWHGLNARQAAAALAALDE